MSNFDTVSGKYRATFWFCDHYDIFDRRPGNDTIDILTAPEFSSEQDAEAAEELAFDVLLATLRATGEARMARIIEKDKRRD